MKAPVRRAGPSLFVCCLALAVAGLVAVWAMGQPRPPAPSSRPAPGRDVLPARQWAQLELSVDRALAWLATEQRPDGSFPTHDPGQPAVTALCTLAFLSRGHAPGEGPYGKLIDQAIEYTLSCQHPDGLIARHYPSMPHGNHNPSHTAHYNHSIGGLCLSEAYGMTTGDANRRIRSAVESALRYAFERRPVPKAHPKDEGGWRYVQHQSDHDSDLSITSWHLMFLRSARNAGFDVPVKYIDEGLAYVRRCYSPQRQCFAYAVSDGRATRGMTGAGILSLSLAGEHNTDMARSSGDWLLQHPFSQYGVTLGDGDAYFYSAFYCSQAMLQLGGRYWTEFFPTLSETLIANQSPDGSWPPEVNRGTEFGRTYSTALAVLTLTAPSQLLPILQR